MKLPFGISRTPYLLAVAAIALFSFANLFAQQRAGEGNERLVPEKNWGKEATDELKVFQSLRKGEQPITEANKALLDRGAQWFAYRLTFIEFHDPGKAGATSIHKICQEALDQIVDPRVGRPSPNLLQFKEEFDKRFVKRLQEVTKNPRPAARINAIIILNKLAETGCEESADVLAEVIKDPKETDGAKFVAFRGLGQLFALGYGENGTPMKNKEREAKSIAALIDYVTSKPNLPDNASTEEIGASNYVRREAIAALGRTRYPGVAIPVDKKTFKIGQTTALVLVKLMRGDEQPKEPTLPEQVAAAVGLCHLQAKLLEQYNPDYAAHQVGRFIADFVRQYTEVDPTNKKQLPWKSMSANLIQALRELKGEGGNRDSAAYIEKMCALAEPLLQDIIAGPPKSPDRKLLVDWLDQNLPKHATLYQGVATAVVRGPDKTGE